MTTTVGEMKQTNIHVMTLNNVFLKDAQTVVTNLEQNVHAVAQGTFYAAIPTSTIPALVQNPQLYGIGVGLGAAAGCIIRLTSTIPSTTWKNWTDWLVHTAAMNNLSKGVFGTLQAAGITGNTLLGIFENSQNTILFEGGLAGAILGFEAAGVALSTLSPQTTTPPSGTTKNPTTPPPSSPPVSNTLEIV
jgi:hypothetical protein